MTRGFATLRAAALCGLIPIAALMMSLTGASAQGGPPTYEVTLRDPNALEIRFHNIPMRGVHADAAQNALSIDFLSAVDGGAFDRLPAEIPDWISVAYANYDTGVIRASRPVTFMTRKEADGFSLRLVARGPAPMPPPGPVALRGGYNGDGGPMPMPPPMPAGYTGAPPPSVFARYDSYAAMRGYAKHQLAVRRADPVWDTAYRRSAMQSDSDLEIGTEYHSYHSGDTVIASHARARVALDDGVGLIGRVDHAAMTSDKLRMPGGAFALNQRTDLVTGAGGFFFETGRDTEFTLEALEGNNITGGRFTGYTGDPDSFWLLNLTYHASNLDTPEAIVNRGLKDEAVLATGQHLGYGIWASLGGHFTNNGVHGNASVAKTAGWDANLRWSADLGPVMAGLSYDGHGDYLFDNATFTGAVPTPYVPLSIRNMETHAATGQMSSLLWGDTLWLDLYGGYVTDRYASDGAIYGGAIRYRPTPGFDLALGARHSGVSMVQGERGNEISAGLTLTLGFNGPKYDYF